MSSPRVTMAEVAQCASSLFRAADEEARMMVVDEFCAHHKGVSHLRDVVVQAVDTPFGTVDTRITEVPRQFHVDQWLPYRLVDEDIEKDLVGPGLAPTAHLDVPEKEFHADGVEGIDWVWDENSARKISPNPREDIALVRGFMYQVVLWMGCEAHMESMDENLEFIRTVWDTSFAKYAACAPSMDTFEEILRETFFPTPERYAAALYLVLKDHGVAMAEA